MRTIFVTSHSVFLVTFFTLFFMQGPFLDQNKKIVFIVMNQANQMTKKTSHVPDLERLNSLIFKSTADPLEDFSMLEVQKEAFKKNPLLELKFDQYKKDLKNHFDACKKIELSKASLVIKELFFMYGRKVSFFLEINKDGSIKSLIFVQLSGVAILDNFLKTLIENMVPFPSIPNHLGTDSLVVTDLLAR